LSQELIELKESGEIIISDKKLEQLTQASKLESYKDNYSIRGLYQEVSLPLKLDGFEGKRSKEPKPILFLSDSSLQLDFFINLSQLASEDRLILAKIDSSFSLPQSAESFLLTSFSSEQKLFFHDNFPFYNSSIAIDGIIFKKLKSSFGGNDYGDAADCQVNAICPAATNTEPSAATTRILWINGNIAGWCTGSLINNTAGDFKPYVLSAEHCALAGSLVSTNDLNRWVFFFNYLNPNCEEPNQESNLPQQQLSGASIRARSNDNGGDSGSDFLLLELNEEIPESFQAYFAGWNRSGILSSKGDCFHHPAGDAQKLSTYRERPSLSSFGGNVPNTHLNVFWQENAFGFGTTEGGSSGSALLDEDGLIIGSLTGGSSSCQQTELSDLFGRFAYSWINNGESPERQLAPWLDPLQLNNLRLQGIAKGDSVIYNSLNTISFFPNPVKDGLAEIKGFTDLQKPVQIALFSFAGTKLQEKRTTPFANGTIPLNLEELQGGLYILQIRQADNTKTIKIWIL